MGCCGRAVLLATLAGPAVAGAQAPDSLPLRSAVQQRVADAVAALWEVPRDRLRLEWGLLPDGETVPDSAGVRVLGRGMDGWFAVLIDRPGLAPVAARLRVASLDRIPVATRSLPGGATLAAADIAFVDRDRWGPPEPAGAGIEPAAGWTVRRPVAAGESLAPPRTVPPLLVTAGSRVRLEWSRGSVQVAIEGHALSAGALGQEIRVRLDDRRGRVTGVVTGPGAAQLVGRRTP